MRDSVMYRFKACQCLDVSGRLQDIPAGIYHTAELSAVTIAAGNLRFDLDLNAFNALKAAGTVEKIR